MMSPAFEIIERLQGKTLATAESCTGGAVGAALTAVAGASRVYKGGIVSYCNEVKQELLHVSAEILEQYGAVSAPVAEAMAVGARKMLYADVAVSVTGLAGPAGDEYGNPVGTVYIAYADEKICISRRFLFEGDRDFVRIQSVNAALELILENC
ncbi:MAG: CinA family protein [Ruminococcaceae bacterium]|nr:CinA family protein [Oscillospiraceae bacterium]